MMEKAKEILIKVLRFLKSAVRGIAFLCLTVFLIATCYHVLSWKDTLGDYISSTTQLYSTEDNKMDVLFLGSSHCYCSVAPALIWNETGIASFNMTTSGQDKNSTVHYLKEALKTQSPEVVFVELWGLTFDEHMVEGNIHRNMMGMPLSENSIELINDYVKDETMNEAYKLRWPIVHTRYKELDKYDFIQYDFSEYGRGVDFNYNSTLAGRPDGAIATEISVPLSMTNEAWIKELHAISKEEGFDLVFFMAPAAIGVEEQCQVNAVKEYAEENGLGFIDFHQHLDEIGIDYATDFIDNWHLNGYGAEKVSSYLSNYLVENYDLKDHRGDAGYEQWDKSYERYVQVKNTYLLQNSVFFEQYISQLMQMDNVVWFLSLEGNFAMSQIQPSYAAGVLGINAEEYLKGGTFMWKDGKLKRIMDNQSTETFIYEVDEYDSFRIQNMSLEDPSMNNMSDIMFNLDPVMTYNDGLNFVVYDEITHQIISTFGFY